MTRRGRLLADCAPGTVERVVQAFVGVLLAAFALDSLAEPALAALAAAGSALLITGAIRGWCPNALLARRTASANAEGDPEHPNRLGFPEARQPLDR